MKAKVDDFEVGDLVDVHTKILEGNKERIQIFSGTVIARSGSGTREMFVVRRIVGGEGVERKFPLHSPKIDKIDVKRKSVVRRAKLYFLRDRSGKPFDFENDESNRCVVSSPRFATEFDFKAIACAMAFFVCSKPTRPPIARPKRRAIGCKVPTGIGYRILARSYRSMRSEIDIIALDARRSSFLK